ncbi:Oligoribonuclease [Nymphon striatum]|nr:Oligoribonuclease [Nymphon striatum]
MQFFTILMEIMMEAESNVINKDNLIWLDMEMSGLLPDTDRILELAAVVTDAELNVLGESPVIVIHQSDAVLNGMDAWNTGTHGRSGLTEKVKVSTTDEEAGTKEMIAFLEQPASRQCVETLSAKIAALWRVICQS